MSSLKKHVYYLKSTGTCVVIVGCCWFFYQLRQTTQILRSAVATNVLDAKQGRSQYIYTDDPRFKDVFTFWGEKDLQSSMVQRHAFLSNFIVQTWRSLRHELLLRLLHVAQYGDKFERHKAVHTLTTTKYLKDWHYQYIAQKLDAETAIAFARMPNVDLRFFLRPPYDHIQHKLYDVIEEVHSLLLQLNTLCSSAHPCLLQFLNKKFGDSLFDSLIFEHDLTSVGLVPAPAIIWDREFLKSCVQVLCHHSCLEKFSKDIVDAGGLPVLMMMKKICNNDNDIRILLAKIISNISLHTEYLDDIFKSGWIGTLVEWSHSSDIRLSAPAGRALANLDTDENQDVKYPRRIYLLHPLIRTGLAAKLDVVFLHGLLGGVFITWRQRDIDTSLNRVVDSQMIAPESETPVTTVIDEHPQDFVEDFVRDLKLREWRKLGQDFEVVLNDCPENTNPQACGPYFCRGYDPCMDTDDCDEVNRTKCWPKDWLPKDIPSIRVLGVNYDTNLSMWTPLCPIDGVKSTMHERSEEYIEKLLTAGVGKRPVVWVCHSMGGLLVKRMLVDEWKKGDKHNICKSTRGIIFYSTPHRGSRVAVLKQMVEMLVWPSVEVQELREESSHLIQLHEEFLNMLKSYPIEIVTFCETKPTPVTALKLSYQFVTSKSANPGVGEFFEIPQDHLSICKPANRQSFLYQKLLSVLRHYVASRE